jgi:hypothetical protein
MSEPLTHGREAPTRGLLLTGAALVLGVLVLASIGRVSPSRNTALVTPPAVTTTLPPVTTTTTLASTHSPSSVKVLVANGTSTSGVAGRLSSKLSAAGYDTLSPTDTLTPARASAVYYLTGYQADAEAVASLLGLGTGVTQTMSSSVPVATKDAEVVVVIGPDLASSSTASSSSGSGSSSSSSSSSGSSSATSSTTSSTTSTTTG